MTSSITSYQAKQIGRKYGLSAAVVGLLVAFLLLVVQWILVAPDLSNSSNYLSALVNFIELGISQVGLPQLVFSIIVMLISGYFMSRRAGQLILVKYWRPIPVGILTGFLVMLTGGVLNLFYEIIKVAVFTSNDEPKPLFLFPLTPLSYLIGFLIEGFIPALLAGAWFGKRIQKVDSKSEE